MPHGNLSAPSLISCDYVKSFDYGEPSATFIKRVSDELAKQIVSNLFDLIDPIREGADAQDSPTLSLLLSAHRRAGGGAAGGHQGLVVVHPPG